MRVRPRPGVEALRAYRLGVVEAPVKLNQNECPYDLPPDLKEEVLAALRAAPWNRYPPMRADRCREAVASSCGVPPDHVLVTNGSNEAILALFQTFATGGVVVLAEPGYSMAPALAVAAGARPHGVPLRSDLTVDAQALAQAAQEHRAVVFVASPNNPTGRAADPETLESLLQRAPGLVVVDEAYWGFSPWSPLALLHRYPHLAVLRTASKALGLAGARVGWIVAHPEVVDAVGRVLPPYNVNLFAQAAVEAAARRPELVAQRVREVVAERERLAAGLRSLGVQVFPSDANFLLIRVRDAQETFARLLERGVLVRDVSRFPLLAGCLRVTVGTPEENDAFLEALRAAQEVAV